MVANTYVIPIEDSIEISDALNSILNEYSEEVGLAVQKSVKETMDSMKKETKETAPVDDGRWEKNGRMAIKTGASFPNHRARNGKTHGEFKRKISKKSTGKGFAYESTWYVKAPEYRLTHLLIHGHEKFIFGKDTGERVDGSMFLHNARDNAAKLITELVVKNVEEVSK